MSSKTSKYFPFLLECLLETKDDRPLITLTAPFVYIDDEKGLEIIISTGFVCDLNSTPRLIWTYFPPTQYLHAGLVHDYLYRAPKGPYGANGAILDLTRERCDDIHRRILHLEGCRWSKRQAIWLALRAGGWVAWAKHRALDP